MKQNNCSRFIPILAVLLLLVSACASAVPQPTSAPVATARLQVSWVPDVEFAGFYMARAKGYYSAENLDFKLDGGGVDAAGNYIDPITRVTSGQDDFGILDGGTMLTARAGGAPVVAIASIYQLHPLAFTSLAEKKIVKPQDLIGKTIQVTDSDLPALKALLASQKIDLSQVKIVQRTDLTTAPLTDGTADVINAWVTNEVIDLKLAGKAVNTILITDYGINTNSEVLFTTEDMIAKHPEVVERFLRASLKGIKAAIDNSDDAAVLTQKEVPTLSLERLKLSMSESVQLLKPAGTQPGMMNDDSWTTTYQILIDQKILTKAMDVKQAYTKQFLNLIYAKN